MYAIKKQKQFKGFVLLAVFLSLLVSSFLTMSQSVNAARCYEEKRRLVNGLYTDENPEIRPAITCDYSQMSELGYNLGGLPNPFPAGETCYLWRTISGGLDVAPQTVNCEDPLVASEEANTVATPPPPPTLPSDSPAPTDSEPDCEIGTNQRIDEDNCDILGYLNMALNLVSGGVAIAVIGNIIFAGIQYSTAQGDPSAASKAKNRIRGAVIAFIMYACLYAFIQWLIPGGVFS